jgi:demethylspheroidene O-methyltransferase
MSAVEEERALRAPTTVVVPARPVPGWRDRMLAWRDRLYASPAFHRWAGAFPLTAAIAHRRSRALFDLCAGFVYSQTLLACTRLDLFRLLAPEPLSLARIAVETGLTVEATERLVRAACALRLLERRSGDRYGLGSVGGPLVGNVALAALVEHNQLLYEDLRDPVALLRGGPRGDASTVLARYYPYAASGAAAAATLPPERVAAYSATMASTLPPLATEILDAYDFSRHRALLDVGGGEGVFLASLAERYPQVSRMLFDLPAVCERAARRLGAGVRIVPGNFHIGALPTGADVVTLIRILLDHDDASALGILRAVRAALPTGGTLLVAEAFAGVSGVERVGDTYFGLYLYAMGRGRARTAAELRDLIAQAGFASSRVVRTTYPLQTGLLVARA